MLFGYFYLCLFIGYKMPWLINAIQLDKLRKDQKNVVILDATWHLPQANRNAKEEFLAKHIVGARFLNLDQFHDQENSLPNMLIRDEKKLCELISRLGIGHEQKIIFYDNSDLYSSCRALWMFKVFGHSPQLLYLLDGGLNAWERYGGKSELGEARHIPIKNYQVQFQSQYCRTLTQMKVNLHHPQEQVIDLRHPVRYSGGPEIREGLRSGHIPESFCFPYFSLYGQEGLLKPLDKIKKQLYNIGIDLNLPIVTTCGSGITSATLNFVLDLLNHSSHALYDGSWSEWGEKKLYPGEESLAERPVVTCLEK